MRWWGYFVAGVILLLVVLWIINSSTDGILPDLSHFVLFPQSDVVYVYPNTNLTLYSPSSISPWDWFNPSVVLSPSKNGYIALVRESDFHGRKDFNRSTPPWFSRTVLCKIGFDGTLKASSLVRFNYDDLKECRGKNSVFGNGIEDARLFRYKNELWAVANVLGSKEQHDPCVNAMLLFKVGDNQPLKIQPLSITGVPTSQRQKNWCPFEYTSNQQTQLLCEYNINPHIIIDCTKAETNGGVCTKLVSTYNHDIPHKHLSGGACPILLRDMHTQASSGYINVCHNYEITATGKHYYNFIYLFESTPPFSITHMSRPFKIAKGEKIQFVSGLDYDHSTGEVILSYGIDDSGIHIARFDLEMLLKQTSPIN